MYLLIMRVHAADAGLPRGVSVWVEAAEVEQARALATLRLAEAGWIVQSIDSASLTSAEDYFRPCPSQQAFLRAEAEQVAWRFDDE